MESIARCSEAIRNLIPSGMLLKVSYCSVVFFHWFASGISGMWKLFAIIDLVFLALFVWAIVSLRKMQETQLTRCGIESHYGFLPS
jgi:hypothetical protein